MTAMVILLLVFFAFYAMHSHETLLEWNRSGRIFGDTEQMARDFQTELEGG